ncbi:hypothetical protein NMYAN_300008 [Nitrosomonas nitrosa]|uniref:Uncharacterized protein n=1 Tax=Nitrosomonas nitrosa TaxID=52442 RepID=A0A8H8Z1V1_9PROT|nr:hypothetical protein NMYAN_300008 [Nitrosomonas nitrosa]
MFLLFCVTRRIPWFTKQISQAFTTESTENTELFLLFRVIPRIP